MNYNDNMKNKKEITEIVKAKLWKFGYSVRDYTLIGPVDFDLLVDNKIRVKVGAEVPSVYPKGCDVFATQHKTGAIVFVMKKFRKATSPYEAFGRPKSIKIKNHATVTKRQNDKDVAEEKGDKEKRS